MSIDWVTQPARPISETHRQAALARQNELTKPPGSLGMLESLAVRFAAIQENQQPELKQAWISIFAADHGITAAGISAFPQSVTMAMIHNFSTGGAAISVLAASLGAELEVVDVGACADPGPLPRVLSHRAGAGTADFRTGPAMTMEQLSHALNAGRTAVDRALASKARIFIGGEMGIGNTTAATALLCALLNQDPSAVAGPGTGLDAAGVAHKAEVIRAALDFHRPALTSPMEILRCVGGFEIAALVGACLAAGQQGLPYLVDGFIASTAALVALRLQPTLQPWLFLAHRSAEPGHALVLNALGGEPILALNMRLGEGSGAATALPLLRLACALHSNMATFAEASVAKAL